MPIQGKTAAEAMEKVIHEKKLSNKINYSVLAALSPVADVPASDAPASSSAEGQVPPEMPPPPPPPPLKEVKKPPSPKKPPASPPKIARGTHPDYLNKRL